MGLVPGYKDLTYEERLRKLKLPTLAYRRLRGDLIDVYKILTHKYDPEVCSDMIKCRQGERSNRGHKYKIFKEHVNSKLREYGFPHRVVNLWNVLPERIVSAPSVMSFERRVDKQLSSQDILYNYKASVDLKSVSA